MTESDMSEVLALFAWHKGPTPMDALRRVINRDWARVFDTPPPHVDERTRVYRHTVPPSTLAALVAHRSFDMPPRDPTPPIVLLSSGDKQILVDGRRRVFAAVTRGAWLDALVITT